MELVATGTMIVLDNNQVRLVNVWSEDVIHNGKKSLVPISETKIDLPELTLDEVYWAKGYQSDGTYVVQTYSKIADPMAKNGYCLGDKSASTYYFKVDENGNLAQINPQ